jgi:hypothetical protein
MSVEQNWYNLKEKLMPPKDEFHTFDIDDCIMTTRKVDFEGLEISASLWGLFMVSKKYAEENNIQLDSWSEIQNRFVSQNAAGDIYTEFNAIFGKELTTAALKVLVAHKDEFDASPEFISKFIAMEGIAEFAWKILRKGKVRALTNNTLENQKRRLPKAGLNIAFPIDNIYSGFDRGKRKPRPELFFDAYTDYLCKLINYERDHNMAFWISQEKLVELIANRICRIKMTHYGDSIPQDGGMVLKVNQIFVDTSSWPTHFKIESSKANGDLYGLVFNELILRAKKGVFQPKLNFVRIDESAEKKTIETDPTFGHTITSVRDFAMLNVA